MRDIIFFQLEDQHGGTLEAYVGVDMSIVESRENLLLLRTFGDADAAAAFYRDMGGRHKGLRMRFVTIRE